MVFYSHININRTIITETYILRLKLVHNPTHGGAGVLQHFAQLQESFLVDEQLVLQNGELLFLDHDFVVLHLGLLHVGLISHLWVDDLPVLVELLVVQRLLLVNDLQLLNFIFCIFDILFVLLDNFVDADLILSKYGYFLQSSCLSYIKPLYVSSIMAGSEIIMTFSRESIFRSQSMRSPFIFLFRFL